MVDERRIDEHCLVFVTADGIAVAVNRRHESRNKWSLIQINPVGDSVMCTLKDSLLTA